MDVDVEPPHVHHRPTGHAWLDMVLPVSALFISFLSILIAWHHGEVMKELVRQNERLVAANSLPHLQLVGSNLSDKGEKQVSLNVANQGVGPAEIRSVQLLFEGRPVANLAGLLKACCGGLDYSGLATSTLLGTMVRPGQSIAYLNFPVTAANVEAARRLDEARKRGAIETRLCYCSVFDECWLRTSRDGDRPRPVNQCPAPEPQYRE